MLTDMYMNSAQNDSLCNDYTDFKMCLVDNGDSKVTLTAKVPS
jgi:hypothetical protein